MADGPEKPNMPSDDDIRERFERIRDQLAKEDLPDVPDEEFPHLRNVPRVPDIEHDEVDAKLAHLESRMKKAKTSYEKTYNKEPAKLASSQKDAQGLGLGLVIAYTIMGMPIVGAGVGWLLDRVFKTTIWLGLLGFAGMTLGVILAVVAINNSNKKQ